MHRAASSRQQGTPARAKNDLHARPIKPPERPLVPYMRYSRKMWPKVRSENPEVQLLEIGKIIGQMWREAPDVEKAAFQQEYELDKIEYERQYKGYQQAIASAHAQASRGRAAALNSNNAASALQPVDEEDPYEMGRRRLAAIRYDRDNRLMSDLFSPACLPDSRTIVPQSRIDQLRKQATSLSAHQLKLDEELNKLEENFQRRKSALEENSAKFNERLAELRNDKPEFTEEKYRQYVEQWTEYYLSEYKKFKDAKAEAERPKAQESGDPAVAVSAPTPASEPATVEVDAVQESSEQAEEQPVASSEAVTHEESKTEEPMEVEANKADEETPEPEPSGPPLSESNSTEVSA